MFRCYVSFREATWFSFQKIELHQLNKQFGCPERQGVMRCMSRRTDVGRRGPGERDDWSRKKTTKSMEIRWDQWKSHAKCTNSGWKYSASPRFLGYFRIIWENHDGESNFTLPSGSWLMKWCWPGEHGKHQYHFGHKFSLHSPNSETTWIIQIHLLGPNIGEVIKEPEGKGKLCNASALASICVECG